MKQSVNVAAALSMAPRQRPNPPELDELTVARAQRGDDHARAALIERYQRPVFAVLSRMLRGQRGGPTVEDLAQETFLRVLRALPRFERGGSARLSTWILTIASNLAIDHMRKKRLEVEPLEHAIERLSSNVGADAEAERKLLAELLQRAISDLAPIYRAAFLLREYHGLDYGEIAETLKIDVGTVKSRLSRARSRLRQALAEVHDAR